MPRTRPMGVLSDSYDRRLTLSAALGVVGVGYLLFGLSSSLGTGLPRFDVAGYTVTGLYLGTVLSLFVATLFSDRVFAVPGAE